MTNPTAVYSLKGCKIKERQLFVRTYYVERKLRTATYFIDGGRAYSVDSDDGTISRCNFNAGFLNSGHTKSITPLDEFYWGAVGKDNETEAAPAETDEAETPSAPAETPSEPPSEAAPA
jgi:hypothetical protein